VNSFANAAKIVSLANCPNLGLEIDAFDVIAVGVSMENLEAVFPLQIFLVQFSDFMSQEIGSTEE